MNIAVIATYGAQFLGVLIGLAIPWFWFRVVRWGLSTGKVLAPGWMYLSQSDFDAEKPQDRFTFWTRLMQWTVTAALFEALVLFGLWHTYVQR